MAEAKRIARESLEEISEEEAAALTAAAEADPDNPPLESLEGFVRAKGGRPRSEHPKTRVTMRLDSDVVARLKEDGPGWQTRANATLRKALGLKK
ncbi:BrnA antitoxin family protein [Amorphus sp. 3PC139-8]